MIKSILLMILIFVGAYAQTPAAPSNLHLTPTINSVTVSWQDNSNNETGFKIYRDGVLIATTAANKTSYHDRSLTPRTTYNYTVKSTIVYSVKPVLTTSNFTTDDTKPNGTIVGKIPTNIGDSPIKTYVLRGSGTSFFSVGKDGTVKIRNKVALDKRAVINYAFTAVATNSAGSSVGVAINITYADKTAPVLAAKRLTLAENSTLNESMLAKDRSPVTYSIGKYDFGVFNINAQTGNLTLKAPLDFENPKDSDKNNYYWVQVVATDSAKNSKAVGVRLIIQNTIDVKPVLANFAGTVKESVKAGANIGKIKITNAGDSAISKITLSGTGAAKFSILNSGYIKLNSPVVYKTQAIYNLTAIATNTAGNSNSVTVKMSVIQPPDTVKPVITLRGTATVTADQGDTYTDAGATAIDARDGIITVVTTGTVDTARLGIYTITYTATDKAGNKATKTRTVKVIVKPFITTWKTDNEGRSNDNQIKIEAHYSYDFNCDIDWGDGSADSGVSQDITHTYATAGTYTIKITGDYPWFQTDDKDKLLSVDQWGTTVWKSMKSSFADCSNVVFDTNDAPDLSQVTDMSYMFDEAINFNSPLEHWDVSNVTDMSYMFYKATNFNAPLDNWDVSSVTNMESMFDGRFDEVYFNQPIGSWDVSKVINMNRMFHNAIDFNQSVANWDVSNVTDMSHMFYGLKDFNQPIGNWDVSNVTDMGRMFENTNHFNQPIGDWDVSKVTNMVSMLGNDFNHPIGNWDVSSVTDMGGMLGNDFNHPIGNWDVSNVTDMRFMFASAKDFNHPIGNWDVSKVTDMEYMFARADAFNQPIGSWDVSSVTKMGNMFYKAIAFNQAIYFWDVSRVTDMSFMFHTARSFNQNLTAWNVSNVTNTIYFSYMSGLWSGYRPRF